MKLVLAIVAGAILLFAWFGSPARQPLAVAALPIESRTAKAIPETPRPKPTEIPFDYLSIISSLPTNREGLAEQAEGWCRLEEGLVGKAEGVRERLLSRYESEVDRAYKGLLAVLLAADPETHAKILGDQQALPKQGWDLFHGMALLALVRSRPENAAALRSPERVEWWKQLFRFVEMGVKTVEVAVLNRTTGEYWKLPCSTSTVHSMEGMRLSRECPPTSHPDLRAALLEAYSTEGDWYFVRQLSRSVIQASAASDPSLARSLAETYLGSASEDTAEDGLSLLRETVLPDDAFPFLEKWAKAQTDGYVIREAIHLLGIQKGAASERVLADLYAGRPDYREELLEAMADHGAASFQTVAETELRGREPSFRVIALRILSRMSTEESLKLIIQTAMTDQQSRMRYAALWAMQERNIWSRQEEEVLGSLVSDPNVKIRKFAKELQSARDRSTVRTESLSGWDWPRPGEEEPATAD